MTSAETSIPAPDHGRPHVVLLGAGASLAALPRGEKWGKKLPLMDNFVEVVGLGWMFERRGIEYRGINFEHLFSELSEGGKHNDLVRYIELEVYSYFHGMMLPDHPTLYDHLVLSLRPKDFIATFNWDPFLLQAIERNYRAVKSKPPMVAFLHGCTQIAYCDRHKPIAVRSDRGRCLRCGEETVPTRLLYPIGKKDYNADAHTAASWHDMKIAMNHAYLFTVFGYSAPKSDVEAVKLLKEGWGDPEKRALDEIEIIDVKSESALLETWGPFINSHHYQTMADFRNSLLWRHPRRSCESFWHMTMDINPDPERPQPEVSDLAVLQEWHQEAIALESQLDA